MPPDVSIILVNYNAAEMLRACLESIRSTRGSLRVQTILVDNNSKDDSLEVARRECPDIILLEQKTNLGYVKANNVALPYATAEKLLLLNNDTVLLPGCLQVLVDYMDRHPEAGAVSPQILNPDGTDQGVARSYPSFMSALFGRRSALSRWFPENRWTRRYLIGLHHPNDEPFQCEFLSTACLMMKTADARSIGGLDEEFRHYWVDAELCRRVLELKRTVVCVPQGKLLHFEGQGGSNKSWRRRINSTLTFHRDAYLAYTKLHGLRGWHPRAWLAATLLAVRAGLLMAMQMVRPGKSTTSPSLRHNRISQKPA